MDNEEKLQEILEELRTQNQTQKEIGLALKVLARKEIENRLLHIFESSDELLVYQLSDGDRSTSEISKYVGVSKMTISRLWQKWEEEFGIIETSGYRNPYRAKYSLEELALLFGKSPKKDVPETEERE